jgi:hypothetical protein
MNPDAADPDALTEPDAVDPDAPTDPEAVVVPDAAEPEAAPDPDPELAAILAAACAGVPVPTTWQPL